jgi:predicted transcriptional regulator
MILTQEQIPWGAASMIIRMVAPSYAAARKELAHKIGLGRKPKAAAPAAKAPATRTRKAKAEPELA